VALVAVPSEAATTFENVYSPDGRRQYLRAQARPITLEDIPEVWRHCAVALLAPVARELSPRLAEGLTADVIGATPQGWLRQWDADGRVRPRALDAAETEALRRYSALILSREDLAGAGADAAALAQAERTLTEWARLTPLLAVTCGPDGADLWRDGVAVRYPGFPAREVDPTGAGDVFAATFLCALAATADPVTAMDMANRVAALAVEGIGAAGIPTPEQIAARYLPPA
jgi:sugar/nucleoside kinase (ribokinase family)